MSKFIFLKATENSSNPFSQTGEYSVITEETITKSAIADTYDQHGQQVGSYDAGDYLTICTEEAVKALVQYWADEEDEEKEFAVGDTISCFDQQTSFDFLISKFGGTDNIQLEQEEIRCIEYHDGHNYRTIALDGEGFEPEYEEEDDEEVIEKLNRIIEEMSYEGESGGYSNYSHEEAESITDSHWQGSWAKYEIVLK